MKLSIVIVSYNGKEYLKKCLDSIFNSHLSDFEVIVVDNASLDETSKMLEDLRYNFKFIQNKKNIGFSRANNIGVKHSSGEYLLFLNPDTEINKKAIDTLIKFMESKKNAGCVTCRVLLPNGKLDDSCHRGLPTPWNAFCFFSGLEQLFPGSKIFSGYHMGWEDLNKIHKIHACAGSFMLVRKKAGDEIGWWDEDYFFYGEDLDFCMELEKKSWEIYFIPSVSIIHYKGVSSGIKKISKEISKANRETRILATKHRFSAMKILYTKQYKDKYPKFFTWLVYRFIDTKLWFSLQKI
jgi:GT2 family glycosyltransferase